MAKYGWYMKLVKDHVFLFYCLLQKAAKWRSHMLEKLLIVDDEPDILRVTAMMLKNRGYEILIPYR